MSPPELVVPPVPWSKHTTHAPRILFLYGSLRKRSYSRLLAALGGAWKGKAAAQVDSELENHALAPHKARFRALTSKERLEYRFGDLG